MPRRKDQSPEKNTVTASLDSIDADLTRLGAERASLLDAEAATPLNEKRLHERNAADIEFGALDMRRRRLRYQLEQIDLQETRLLALIPQAQQAERHREWCGFVDAFETLADRARLAAETLAATQSEIHELHVRAARSGFNPHESRSAIIPTISETFVDWRVFTSLPDRVGFLRRITPEAVVRQTRYGVRFARFTIVAVNLVSVGYPAGIVAGFDAATAWSLVERDLAIWVDNRSIPAKPAPKRKRRS